MNIGVHESFQIIIFSGYMSVMGLLHHMVTLFFSFLRKLHIVLHNGCTSLHSHQHHGWVGGVPFSLQPFQHLLFVDFCRLLFSFFGHTCGMWKFWGQGLNPCCNCSLCYNCGKARSLTHCATGNFLFVDFLVTLTGVRCYLIVVSI